MSMLGTGQSPRFRIPSGHGLRTLAALFLAASSTAAPTDDRRSAEVVLVERVTAGDGDSASSGEDLHHWRRPTSGEDWDLAPKVAVRFFARSPSGKLAPISLSSLMVTCLYTPPEGRTSSSYDFFQAGLLLRLKSRASERSAGGFLAAVGTPQRFADKPQLVEGRKYRIGILAYKAEGVLEVPKGLRGGEVASFRMVLPTPAKRGGIDSGEKGVVIRGRIAAPTLGDSEGTGWLVAYADGNHRYREGRAETDGSFRLNVTELGGVLVATPNTRNRESSEPRLFVCGLDKPDVVLPRDANLVFRKGEGAKRRFVIPPGLPVSARSTSLTLFAGEDTLVAVLDLELQGFVAEGKLSAEKGGAVDLFCWPGDFWVRLEVPPDLRNSRALRQWSFGKVTIPVNADTPVPLPVPTEVPK